MAFRLKQHESVTKGVKRIIRCQMEDALVALASEKHDAVHDIRVHFKKIRACLRAVRGGLGDTIYRRENRRFRDVARPLTLVRDTEILIETLDRLAGHFARQLAAEDFSAIRKELLARHQAMRKRVLDKERAFASITKTVKNTCNRLKDWPMKRKGWAALNDGLRRSYRRNRNAFTEAQHHPTAENFHEWRKQAKYLWYQLLMLERAWPRKVKAWDKALHTLTQALGDNHDLAVLRQTLAADSVTFGKNVDILLPLIDCRQKELQKQAFMLGDRLYRDKSGIFVRQIGKRWKKWRSDY